MSDQGGSEFGPAVPSSPAAAPFSVSGQTDVTLDENRQGVISFVIANTTGRPVTVRLLVQPVDGADARWFTLEGSTDRPMTVAATLSAEVRIVIPPDAPAGRHGIRLDAALEEAPEQLAAGPTAVFTVAEPKKKRSFPWWIIVVIVGALLLLGGAPGPSRHSSWTTTDLPRLRARARPRAPPRRSLRWRIGASRATSTASPGPRTRCAYSRSRRPRSSSTTAR